MKVKSRRPTSKKRERERERERESKKGPMFSLGSMSAKERKRENEQANSYTAAASIVRTKHLFS